MSKWEEKQIASLGKVITGKTPSKTEPSYWNGEEPFVSPKDMKRDSLYIYKTQTTISKLALEKFKSQVVPKNAIMYTSLSFGFGKIGLASRNVITNQQINSIIVNKENDFRFIYYLLRINTPYIFMYNSGIETPFVPKSVFEKIKLLVPPLPAQQKIADILSAYDDLIENNNRRIELLEKAAENLYKEWFMRFRFPNYKETKFVNGLPQGWKIEKLKNISEFTYGKMPNKEKIKEFGYPIFSGYRVVGYYDEFMYKDEMLILVARGVGGTGDVKFSPAESYITNLSIVFLLKDNSLLKNYLYQMFNLHSLRYLDSGAAQSQITIDNLKRVKVILPNRTLLEKYNNHIRLVRTEINNLQTQTQNLIKQRDLLLPRLMSGKLEV